MQAGAASTVRVPVPSVHAYDWLPTRTVPYRWYRRHSTVHHVATVLVQYCTVPVEQSLEWGLGTLDEKYLNLISGSTSRLCSSVRLDLAGTWQTQHGETLGRPGDTTGTQRDSRHRAQGLARIRTVSRSLTLEDQHRKRSAGAGNLPFFLYYRPESSPRLRASF